jgi:hypothetical protein
MSRKVLRFKLTVLACAVLLCGGALNVRAQHEKHDMQSMPGMQPTAPAPSPSPTPAPDKMAMPAPTPAIDAGQQPAATPGNAGEMDKMDMSGGEQKPAANPHDSMPGMKHDSMQGANADGANKADQIPTTDSLGLMVMTEREMSIRVGTSRSNTLNMSQMGSGTSWQPATTPMSMYFKYANGWLLFLHAEAKLGVNAQGGPRGVTKFESQNWVMPMAFRRVHHGTLQLRGMFSLEPFTFSPGGSPQLFQTGESYKGRPLVDRQHPHDLFMELSATYTMPLGERSTWFAYVGFPGEPALGPTAFMHRNSASENPSAPLAHHLQDSTHIAFGVFTTGVTYRWLKLEGSLFNGQEPDENRYNFEFNPWSSSAVRLSFAPTENWSMQVSHGFLKKPEALEPGDIRRTTASISHNKNFQRGNWSSSLIWGRNHANRNGEIANQNGYTIESTLNFLDLNYVYTRLELVDKNELLSDEDRARLGITEDHPSFRIGAYTLGAAREVWNTDKLSIAIGGDFTFYSKPSILDALYGSNPTSYKLFLRLRPSRMTMSGHQMPGNTGQP